MGFSTKSKRIHCWGKDVGAGREPPLAAGGQSMLAKADLVPGMWIFAGGRPFEPDHCFFILRAELNVPFWACMGLVQLWRRGWPWEGC